MLFQVEYSFPAIAICFLVFFASPVPAVSAGYNACVARTQTMKCILQLCIPDIVPLSFCDVPKTSYEDWFQNVEKSFVCHKAKKFIEEYEQGNASLPDTDNSSTSFAITPPIKQENCIKHEVRKDYENIPDSRPSHKHKDTLSSEHDFISSPILFAYIWFLAVCSLLGNLILIGCTLNVFRTTYKTLSAVKRIHNTMLLNLAFSDLLMAFYMCNIGITATAFMGNYSYETRIKWTVSAGCSLIAVLNFISSQVSVTTLVIMTSFRLYGIVRPYSRVVARWAIIWVSGAWVVWSLVACIPLIRAESVRSLFISSVLLQISNGTKNSEIEVEHYEWLLKDVQYALETVDEVCPTNFTFPQNPTWAKLLFFSDRLVKSYKYEKDIGYYGEQSLCTMKYFVSYHDRSSFFTASVMTYNFISFLYIFFAYTYIHYEISKGNWTCAFGVFRKMFSKSENKNLDCRSPGPSDMRSKENRNLHRLVVAVIVSDFFCWVPLSLVSFWYINHTRHMNAHEFWEFFKETKKQLAIVALVMTPINSVVNPIIHSGRLRNMFKSVIRKLFYRSTNMTQNISPASRDESAIHEMNDEACAYCATEV